MKETILIVEDDPSTSKLIRQSIQTVGDDATNILEAASSDEAIKHAKSGRIFYCALDLGLPQTKGGKIVELDEKCRLGFAVLRELLSKNRHVEVRVLSRHTDISQIRDLLKREFSDDARILSPQDKNKDGDYLEKVAHDVMGLADMRPALDAQQIRALHPLERRLARRLWKIANIQWTWPTPRIVFRGESQMGKDWWAKGLVEFRARRHQCANRVQFREYDLGKIRDAGDSPIVTLFGAANYQGIRGSHKGLFEKATHHDANGQPDFHRSNFAILSELGNLPADCQPLLLEVLRTGRVTKAGAGNSDIPVGCGFIFTTNARLEKRIAASDSAVGGQLRRDLFERLSVTPDNWLFVPSFADMGCDAFFEHLRSALEAQVGNRYEIAPIAQAVIEDAFEKTPQDFTQRSIETIVQSFFGSGSSRLDADHVRTIVTRKVSAKSSYTPESQTLHNDTDVSSQREVVRNEIVNSLGLNLHGAWNSDDFSVACKTRSFKTQKEFESFVQTMQRLSGSDRSVGRDASPTSRRRLFAEAIGYPGDDLLGYLGQIRYQIVERSEGKLKAVDRLKRK
jgi:DNA-binding NtrC family response regulator